MQTEGDLMKRLTAFMIAGLLPACVTPGPKPYDCLNPTVRGVIQVQGAEVGKYIVVLKPATTRSVHTFAETRSMAQRWGVTEYKHLSVGVAITLPVTRGLAVDTSVLKKILADPAVAFVQEDGKKSIRGVDYGLDRIDQRDLPLDGRYDPGSTGAGVHAYSIDTGVDITHPEFAGRVGEGFSVFGGEQTDLHGHGTHTAGTIAGKTFGVARGAIIHGVQVLDKDGSGSDSQVIEGIDWVASHMRANHWPAVANMSLGGSASPALDQAVCNAITAGVAFAIAAGNESQDACNSSPARVTQALTMAASDSRDGAASFSNFGKTCVDAWGPGVDIESAAPGGGSQTMSGTSMASPHGAGALVLCLERHPGGDPVACVLSHATLDKISGGGDTPNKLLFVREP